MSNVVDNYWRFVNLMELTKSNLASVTSTSDSHQQQLSAALLAQNLGIRSPRVSIRLSEISPVIIKMLLTCDNLP